MNGIARCDSGLTFQIWFPEYLTSRAIHYSKRWQNIDEFPRAEINVWTALNVSNLESLKMSSR